MNAHFAARIQKRRHRSGLQEPHRFPPLLFAFLSAGVQDDARPADDRERAHDQNDGEQDEMLGRRLSEFHRDPFRLPISWIWPPVGTSCHSRPMSLSSRCI